MRTQSCRGTRAAVVALVLSTATIGSVSIAAALQPLSYQHDVAVPVGANAKSFTVADCNRDGFPDLVGSGQNSNDAIQFLNRGDRTFSFDRRVVVGTQPTGAACADFDGDGLVDVAAVSRDAGKLFVYRRLPADGGYEQWGSRTVGLLPIALAAGDLNGDGILDLVAVNERSNDVTVMIGTGNGVPLASTVRIPTDSPRAASIADLNGDGRADIVIATNDDPGVIVLLNTGAGFSPSPATAVFPGTPPPREARGVAAGDVTGDGIADLAVVTRDTVLTLYRGRGDGSFDQHRELAMPTTAGALHLGDFDADGVADLAVLFPESNVIRVLFATAPGDFGLPAAESAQHAALVPAHNPAGPVAARARTAAAVATPDFVSVNRDARTLDLLRSDGGAALATSRIAALQDPPQTVLLADMTGDGIEDAVILSTPSSRNARTRGLLQVRPGDGAGGYGAPAGGVATCGDGRVEGAELCDDGNVKAGDGCAATCVPELGRAVVAVAAADLDGDGATDLVAVDQRGVMRLLVGDGGGRFTAIRELERARGGSVAVTDFTGDGRADVAFLPSRDRGAAILASEGGGRFRRRALPARVPLTGPLLAIDVDDDGDSDLVAGAKTGVAVFLDEGAGPAREVVGVEGIRRVLHLGAADFDSDGALDLLVSSRAARAMPLRLFYGTGHGTFGRETTLRKDAAFARPLIADVNGDRRYDVLSCVSGCAVLHPSGVGTPGEPSLAPVLIGPDASGAGAADFDRDGEVDLVGISKETHRAVVVFGGDGPLADRRLELETGRGPTALAVADFNDDGLDDFIVVNEDSKDFSIYTRDPARSRRFIVTAPQRLPVGALGAIGLAVGDVDGNGRLDIAVTQSGSATVTIYRSVGIAFAELGTWPTGHDPRGVTFGRFNADDHLDFATANRGSDSVSIFLSGPGGTYARRDIASSGLQPAAVAALDLDGDGFDELAVLNEKIENSSRLGNVALYRNDGEGGFPGPAEVLVRGRETPRDACVGDFDGDGVADVAVASFDSSDILLLHGDGAGSWRRDEKAFGVGGKVSGIDCHDADGDGRTDVAYARKNPGDVGVILTDR